MNWNYFAILIMKEVGTSPREKKALKRISRGLDITYLITFNILTGILKDPVSFPDINLDISSTVSWDVTGKMQKLSDEDSAI